MGVGSVPSTSAADGGRLAQSHWLGPDARTEALTSEPREFLSPLPADPRQRFLIGLGRLAFRSPAVFGGWVGRESLSCHTCHAGGVAQVRFFSPQTSDRASNVDVSHEFWNPRSDDGRANAVNIPSLRGVGSTAPYGRDGRRSTLAAFTRDVIVTEFAGLEPTPLLLDALVAYQQALAFPPNPHLGADGALVATAPAAVRRGETLFRRDCAACHVPATAFRDGRNHDVGTNGVFETPTLRGLADTAPYFHDGRAADLGAVVDHFDRTLRLGYDRDARDAVIAYLDAVGAVDGGAQPITLDRAVADIRTFAGLIKTPLASREAEAVDWIVSLVRRQIGTIDERFHRSEHAPAHDILAGWSRRLAAIAAMATERRFNEAQRALEAWDQDVGRDLPRLVTYEPSSLYRAEEIAADR